MFECTICGRSFHSNQGLIQHTEGTHGRTGVHRGVIAWEHSRRQSGVITTGSHCVEYSYQVNDSQYDSEEEMWNCGMCNRRFNQKRQLEQHLNSGVHEHGRYACQECGKRMASLAALTQHLSATGHARNESRLVDVMLHDARHQGQLMITNGSAPPLIHECTLYFDGAVSPNPASRGGCGYRLLDHHDAYLEDGGNAVYPIPSFYDVTNNQAEYAGLIAGMSAAVRLGVKRLKVKGDSELVVNHMRGIYQCRSDRLSSLYNVAKKLQSEFQICDFEWISRNDNIEADSLANCYAR